MQLIAGDGGGRCRRPAAGGGRTDAMRCDPMETSPLQPDLTNQRQKTSCDKHNMSTYIARRKLRGLWLTDRQGHRLSES